MERSDRIRIAAVAVLALLVIGGVVASALHARRADDEDAVPALADRPTAEDPPRRRNRGEEPLPDDCTPKPGAEPAIRFDLPADHVDFGPLRQGEVVERDVGVQNEGAGVLCILDQQTGCGCVKATWKGENRIPPGGRGTLHLRVDTTGREGKQDRTVRLFTNQTSRSVAELRITADIRLGIVVTGTTGGSVSLGIHAVGRPASHAVRLRCPKDDPPWEVTSVESAAPEGERTAWTWEAKAVEPNDPEFRHLDVVLTHPGRDRVGPAYERIRIATTHPGRPEILLETQMNVVPKYYASPVRVALGAVRPGSAATRTVFLMAGEQGTPFKALTARVEGDGFAVGAPREVPAGWAVDVRYDGQARAAGRVKAELVVGIDDAEAPEVRVPLTADATGP